MHPSEKAGLLQGGSSVLPREPINVSPGPEWEHRKAMPSPDAAAAGAVDALPSRNQAEVLRGAGAGEPWAHAALYDALYPIVARALQKILHQTPDYEDLVQTSFELIVRTLQRPQAREIENLGAWASAIAARVALDSLRARIRERKIFRRDAEAADA